MKNEIVEKFSVKLATVSLQETVTTTKGHGALALFFLLFLLLPERDFVQFFFELGRCRGHLMLLVVVAVDNWVIEKPLSFYLLITVLLHRWKVVCFFDLLILPLLILEHILLLLHGSEVLQCAYCESLWLIFLFMTWLIFPTIVLDFSIHPNLLLPLFIMSKIWRASLTVRWMLWCRFHADYWDI